MGVIKKIIVIAMMALGGFSGYCQKNLTINVVSFNVRYNSPDDGINIWENRRDWVAGAMRFYEADLIGGQEVTYAQLVDMQDRLGLTQEFLSSWSSEVSSLSSGSLSLNLNRRTFLSCSFGDSSASLLEHKIFFY